MLDYLARAKTCRTANEWNRLHIDLENVLAPQELADLVRRVEAAGPFEKTTKWLDRLRQLQPTLFLTPRWFDSIPLHPNFTFYQGAAESRGRRLLFAFCGNAGRLMLPLPVFLQFLSPEMWDVLLVRKRPGDSYLTGFAGANGGPPSIVAIAKELLAFEKYMSVTCFGTSGGGYAAITAALLIKAECGIAIGAALPLEGSKDYLVPPDIVSETRTRLKFVHGADCQLDAASAGAIARRYAGEVISVPGVAEHDVLGTLIKRGEVGPLLSRLGLTERT